MSKLGTILLVCFAMVMSLWALILLGAYAVGGVSGWLPFAACLILGLKVWAD